MLKYLVRLVIRKVRARLSRPTAIDRVGRELLHSRVHQTALRWLAEPPRLRAEDPWVLSLASCLAHDKWHPRLSWPDALLAKGVVAHDMRRPDDTNRMALAAYLDRTGGPAAPLSTHPTSPDFAINGEAMLYLDRVTGTRRFGALLHEMSASLHDQRGCDGTVPYRGASAELRYVDTVGMICPFLAEFAAAYQQEQAADLAVNQLMAFIRHGVHQTSGLPFHAYNVSLGGAPVGQVGWGRGAGWYGLGLIDTLPHLNQARPEHSEIRQAASHLANTLARMERPEGGWGTRLGDHGSHFDASATSMCGYFLARALEEGILGTDWLPRIGRTANALLSNTSHHGITHSAQGACMGLDHYSRHTSSAAFAQGMTLAFITCAEHATGILLSGESCGNE